jgi:hypothetical protein
MPAETVAEREAREKAEREAATKEATPAAPKTRISRITGEEVPIVAMAEVACENCGTLLSVRKTQADGLELFDCPLCRARHNATPEAIAASLKN